MLMAGVIPAVAVRLSLNNPTSLREISRHYFEEVKFSIFCIYVLLTI